MNTLDSFEALPLAAPLKRALREKNYTTPSPIQAEAIPHLLEGRDLLGAAQTGTGKTAAFALPILHHLHGQGRRPAPRKPRALVLTPTRELAVQVGKSFEAYGRHLNLSCALVYGGVAAGPQVRALRRGVDVLVATPGRLLDLFGQGHIDFGATGFLVLDEADRMLDMGFLPDIRKIVAQLPQERQSLCFSATFSPAITRLAESMLREPIQIRVAPDEPTAEKIDHRICFLQHEDKLPLLQSLLGEQSGRDGPHLTLVFSRTKHGADRLAKTLSRGGVRAEAIHGNKSQAARQKALESFRRGRSAVLVATDVAARGIDVRDITLVVNYDMPNEPEAYVHRIGRTARAGAEGTALSFCTSQDLGELAAIEKLVRGAIPVHAAHPFHQAGLEGRYSSGPRNGGGRKSSRGKSPGGRRGGGSQQRPRRSGRRGPARRFAAP